MYILSKMSSSQYSTHRKRDSTSSNRKGGVLNIIISQLVWHSKWRLIRKVSEWFKGNSLVLNSNLVIYGPGIYIRILKQYHKAYPYNVPTIIFVISKLNYKLASFANNLIRWWNKTDHVTSYPSCTATEAYFSTHSPQDTRQRFGPLTPLSSRYQTDIVTSHPALP